MSTTMHSRVSVFPSDLMVGDYLLLDSGGGTIVRVSEGIDLYELGYHEIEFEGPNGTELINVKSDNRINILDQE